MTSRSRRDSRGPGRGGRHRARTPVRTPSRPAPDLLRRRARALLAVPAARPGKGRTAPLLVPGRSYRGARVLVHRAAASEALTAHGGARQAPRPLPRAVAIAAARAAVQRSRTAVAPPAGAASRRRGRRPDPVEPPPAGGAREAAATGGTRPTAGARLRTAVLERLPLWVQLRCAVEPRTLAALVVVLLVATGFAVHHFLDGRPEAVPVPKAVSAAASLDTGTDPAGAAATASGGGRLVVDVAGKVRDPGVYRLPRGSRVADALEAAGGVRPGTDEEEPGGLNRARRLVDGEQILVGAAGSAPGPASAGPASTGSGTTRISLSSATAEQLETLPGVGPVLARHIIDYRTAHGGFTSVDQLREVDGIGDARFADIEPEVGP